MNTMRAKLVIIAFPFLVHCASVGTTAGPRFELVVKGSPSIDTIYFSDSKTQIIKNGELADSQDETVIFKVRTETTKIDEKNKSVFQKQTTLTKQGGSKLNEMGFPELKQSISFVYSPSGEVLKAGDFPKTSLFYIPAVPLPDRPVAVGDTWETTYKWIGLSNNIPLEANILTIFKGLEKCDDGNCALLEVSGEVKIMGFASDKSDFRSEIKGKILYALEQGEVWQSHVQTAEVLISGKNRVQVFSCVIGEKQKEKEGIKDTPICDPGLSPWG